MKWILPIVFCLVSFAGKAATINAASVSQSDVLAAVNSAADGDTVLVPAGSATWDSADSFGGAITNYRPIGITLRGSGIGQTIITDGGSGNEKLIYFKNQTSASSISKIEGFTFVCGSSYTLVGMDIGDSASALLAVSDCLFTNILTRAITTWNDVRGVIYNCGFVCPVAGTGISPDGTAAGSSNAWASAWMPGTTNALVVEDCWFDWKTSYANGLIDCYGGSKIAVRNCVATNGNWGNHGTDSSGAVRSTLGVEVYNTTNYATISGVFPLAFRGGSALIWSNRFTDLAGSFYKYMTLAQYRNTGTNVYGPPTPCCSPFGPVSGTNRWDGNTNANGWPALDQIGRTGPSTYNATNTEQASYPVRMWGNIWNGTNWNSVQAGPDQDNLGSLSYIPNPTNMIVLNRDYYLGSEPAGYVALEYPHPLRTLTEPASGGTRGIPLRGIRLHP